MGVSSLGFSLSVSSFRCVCVRVQLLWSHLYVDFHPLLWHICRNIRWLSKFNGCTLEDINSRVGWLITRDHSRMDFPRGATLGLKVGAVHCEKISMYYKTLWTLLIQTNVTPTFYVAIALETIIVCSQLCFVLDIQKLSYLDNTIGSLKPWGIELAMLSNTRTSIIIRYIPCIQENFIRQTVDGTMDTRCSTRSRSIIVVGSLFAHWWTISLVLSFQYQNKLLLFPRDYPTSQHQRFIVVHNHPVITKFR